MKKNLPITDVEVPFPDGEEIISTTNLKGVITSFNETFQAISGFEYDELINKNHNVIRHPEIPPAAFDDLWKTVKTNQHWMGIIKNRVKNGNHYWVDAYVSPIVENGESSAMNQFAQNQAAKGLTALTGFINRSMLANVPKSRVGQPI
ncbi:MAG TPA: PAS domain-containing protein [Methylophaga sp.]|nr:PAS domain-containing protein [Methylophaga sp.]